MDTGETTAQPLAGLLRSVNRLRSSGEVEVRSAQRVIRLRIDKGILFEVIRDGESFAAQLGQRLKESSDINLPQHPVDTVEALWDAVKSSTPPISHSSFVLVARETMLDFILNLCFEEQINAQIHRSDTTSAGHSLALVDISEVISLVDSAPELLRQWEQLLPLGAQLSRSESEGDHNLDPMEESVLAALSEPRSPEELIRLSSLSRLRTIETTLLLFEKGMATLVSDPSPNRGTDDSSETTASHNQAAGAPSTRVRAADGSVRGKSITRRLQFVWIPQVLVWLFLITAVVVPLLMWHEVIELF